MEIARMVAKFGKIFMKFLLYVSCEAWGIFPQTFWLKPCSFFLPLSDSSHELNEACLYSWTQPPALHLRVWLQGELVWWKAEKQEAVFIPEWWEVASVQTWLWPREHIPKIDKMCFPANFPLIGSPVLPVVSPMPLTTSRSIPEGKSGWKETAGQQIEPKYFLQVSQKDNHVTALEGPMQARGLETLALSASQAMKCTVVGTFNWLVICLFFTANKIMNGFQMTVT